jgi:hypothetical protein
MRDLRQARAVLEVANKDFKAMMGNDGRNCVRLTESHSVGALHLGATVRL